MASANRSGTNQVKCTGKATTKYNASASLCKVAEGGTSDSTRVIGAGRADTETLIH